MMSGAQQIPMDFTHRPAHGRDDFLIAPSNHDAVAWIDRWPEWPAPCLILYGPAASGKSHIASVWQDISGATVIDTAHLTSKNADELAALGEHLIIDHVDPWFGDREAETTMFHLYNILKETQRTMLMTTRIAPIRINFEVADLASRLRAAPTVAIQPPDDTLLAAVLVKLFSDRQLQIPHDVLQYVLPRMERSFAAAADLVETVDKLTLAEKRAISIPLMRRVLLQDS